MIYVSFSIKSVVKWSENSVRFDFFMGIAFQIGQFCEILSHSVRYGMYVNIINKISHILFINKIYKLGYKIYPS